jgi:hypothetical protein
MEKFRTYQAETNIFRFFKELDAQEVILYKNATQNSLEKEKNR